MGAGRPASHRKLEYQGREMRMKIVKKSEGRTFLTGRVFLSAVSIQRMTLNCENWRLQLRDPGKPPQ